jgi:hypothetical protein
MARPRLCLQLPPPPERERAAVWLGVVESSIDSRALARRLRGSVDSVAAEPIRTELSR